MYRTEKKHYITPADHAALRRRLNAVMRPDPHAGDGGAYTVHSLYFDDYRDTALREKLDGVPRREKFRLRYYDGDLGFINLEKKSKVRGLCIKESERVDLGDCRALLAGRADQVARRGPLLTEFCAKMNGRQLRPRTCVVYRRDAYCYPAGNVRVTVDYDIGAGSPSGFLDPGQPLVKENGVVLLEVKYDTFLPEHIAGLVEMNNRAGTAYSKYCACAMMRAGSSLR